MLTVSIFRLITVRIESIYCKVLLYPRLTNSSALLKSSRETLSIFVLTRIPKLSGRLKSDWNETMFSICKNKSYSVGGGAFDATELPII